jgi:L-2-hydroxyglutarate oxidase LhgO
MSESTEFLIIGAGIVGLTLAHQLTERRSGASIIVIDKEPEVAMHASGRNSGVLHGGFYYTADSLKARFTVAGNQAMREFCQRYDLPINECAKLVVATNEQELTQLFELERRGKVNGAVVEIIDELEARRIEPNIQTFGKALYSPKTATVDPNIICLKLKEILHSRGVQFRFQSSFISRAGQRVLTSTGSIEAARIINCAGLYADKIAHRFGFGKNYTIIPFKGLYLKYAKNKTDIKTNIYPVPDLRNPFLGVHFTKTVDGTIKIGPTAIPSFWRENYRGFDNFRIGELLSIGMHEFRLFATNSFNFRSLAFDEMRKYRKRHLIKLAQKLVRAIDPSGFGEFTKPGIRAQLLRKDTLQLVQDFIVEGDKQSVHVLNAVSPGFTCSFPVADYIIDHYLH